SLLLLDWLAKLANIESLTVSAQILQILYSVTTDLCKVNFPYLRNLKTLKVKTYRPPSIPDKAVSFLLQNAPSAEVEIIDLSR
ncbi:F-box/LRR-repeat protein, partial [Trifolium medium]|nr:F-box/LRR-repeat protein [Trifolium medium]